MLSVQYRLKVDQDYASFLLSNWDLPNYYLRASTGHPSDKECREENYSPCFLHHLLPTHGSVTGAFCCSA